MNDPLKPVIEKLWDEQQKKFRCFHCKLVGELPYVSSLGDQVIPLCGPCLQQFSEFSLDDMNKVGTIWYAWLRRN
jgi:cytidine deaminase